MNLEQLYKNMYSFWKSGNSLVVLFSWIKDAYNEENGKALMSAFIKKYSKDEELSKEFNSSCFIKNIHG